MLDSLASYYVIMTSKSYPGGCDVTANQMCKMEMKEAGEIMDEYPKYGNNRVIKTTFLINPSLIFSVLCLTANEYALTQPYHDETHHLAKRSELYYSSFIHVAPIFCLNYQELEMNTPRT